MPRAWCFFPDTHQKKPPWETKGSAGTGYAKNKVWDLWYLPLLPAEAAVGALIRCRLAERSLCWTPHTFRANYLLTEPKQTHSVFIKPRKNNGFPQREAEDFKGSQSTDINHGWQSSQGQRMSPCCSSLITGCRFLSPALVEQLLPAVIGSQNSLKNNGF